jgi:hypothetical protein
VVTIIGVLVIGLGGDPVDESVVMPATPATQAPTATVPAPTRPMTSTPMMVTTVRSMTTIVRMAAG